MNRPLIERAEKREYQDLFIQDLNWSAPDQPPVVLEYDGRDVAATNVSQHKGIRVWVVNEKPDQKLELELDRLVAKSSLDRIVIFHDAQEQVWRWPVRRAAGITTTTRLSRHIHRTGSADSRFADRLEVIRLPDDVVLDSNAVLARLRQAFDVESRNETKHASKLMARMYTAMEQAYPAETDSKARDHEISVTLARLLFLMFADDTGMWPDEDVFENFILEHTDADGTDIGGRLTALFDYLDTKPAERAGARSEFDRFRYVNGGIFKERLTLPMIVGESRFGTPFIPGDQTRLTSERVPIMDCVFAASGTQRRQPLKRTWRYGVPGSFPATFRAMTDEHTVCVLTVAVVQTGLNFGGVPFGGLC